VEYEPKELKTGTTTVGIIAKDAVVLAADMKATMGHLSYEKESKKIYKITRHIAVTNAGAVGDSLMLIRWLRAQANIYEIEQDKPVSPKALATLLSNILNAHRMFPYIVQFIVGGYVSKPELYELTPFGGMLERHRYAVSGSGTQLALSTLDQHYKKDMDEKNAIALAIKAIVSSKERDIYTGGRSISVFVIDRKGVKELEENKVKEYVEREMKSRVVY
jgi:proteasome beta subunit